jgi:hypothetical protein
VFQLVLQQRAATHVQVKQYKFQLLINLNLRLEKDLKLQLTKVDLTKFKIGHLAGLADLI